MENLRNPQICNQPPQVTKALTSLVDNSPNFLAGTNPSIADLLALSLAVSNKIGKTQRKIIAKGTTDPRVEFYLPK